MPYISPENVTSPRDYWKLGSVLYDGREGNPSISMGSWESNLVIAMRWNGTSKDGKSKGNPQSTGHPTWFVLPPAVATATLRMLSEKLAAGDPAVKGDALKMAVNKFASTSPLTTGLY